MKTKVKQRDGHVLKSLQRETFSMKTRRETNKRVYSRKNMKIDY